VLLVQGNCSIVLASEGPPLLGVKPPLPGAKLDFAPKTFTPVNVAQASTAQPPALAPPPQSQIAHPNLSPSTTHAMPQFSNPSTLHTSPSSPPPKKLLTALSIPHTLHPFPQQAQTRANSKYARLMASTPASMFDCSDLFDANRLLAVIQRAVDQHSGCACACALVCLCVCLRSR